MNLARPGAHPDARPGMHSGTRSGLLASMRRGMAAPGLVCLVAALCAAGCERPPLADDLSEARRAMREGDAATAQRYLERCLRSATDPDRRWEAWNELLGTARAGGQEDWLADSLEVMLMEYESDPVRSREILFRLAETSEKAGRLERAEMYWGRCLEQADLDPESKATVLRRRAALNNRLRRFEAARADWRACLALPLPGALRAECLFELADGAAARDLPGEAERYAREVLESEEADPALKSRAGFIVGDIQEQREQFAEALATFQSIRDAYPNPLAVDVRIEYLKKKVKNNR